MSPRFHPRLIHGPFGDPGLFLPFMFEKRALVFDLGDLSPLSSRDILKITHAFVTHAHMDHFIGFDAALRLFLGREKHLHVFGPRGMIRHVEGKLAGYEWNLAPNYETEFTLTAVEAGAGRMAARTFRGRDRFAPSGPLEETPFSGVLLDEPGFFVRCAELDHGIPCLGFLLEEKRHIHISKAALDDMGLCPGPWIGAFKEAVLTGADLRAPLQARTTEGRGRIFPLGTLMEKIAIMAPGQKIAYVTDAGFTPSNREKIIDLALGADHLFIEATFSDKDSALAEKKRHLTARQAGRLAAGAGVGRFTLFHFSPRYYGMEAAIQKEAEESFGSAPISP
ncbi:Ribonuclease Z [Candidatus Desulfarcum epimagneticum]|uniref:Ribonuclease Z n=1 Tax=uncultured Desulfobacteraceae bacterium TaxID=218296 RepID=A0A484HG76_9BACT|nr:Ribonuclease Z [uncultured Desulfobacteraceae bacterium]